MTVPLRLDALTPAPLGWRVTAVEGLSPALDRVADAGAPSHRFLRYQWFAAALEAYRTRADTLIVDSEGFGPGIALPYAPVGPRWLRAAMIPGSYWPFRGFPAATGDPAAWEALAAALATRVNVLRIGPVPDDDPAVTLLRAAAARAGWHAWSRAIGDTHVLDIAAQRAQGPWPRNSTLRKNRFHEKHLAAHGALDWRFVDRWDEAAFADLVAIERASWIASRTDGRDAKFTDDGHGRFWRAAVRDPALAAMFNAALLRVAGRPAAFSFDLDAGTTRYAIANSYDPAFAKHSPGKLLYWRNLVAAADRGIARVDWGLGDSGYKAVIGADPGPVLRDWLLFRPGWPARMARAAAPLWRWRTG